MSFQEHTEEIPLQGQRSYKRNCQKVHTEAFSQSHVRSINVTAFKKLENLKVEYCEYYTQVHIEDMLQSQEIISLC